MFYLSASARAIDEPDSDHRALENDFRLIFLKRDRIIFLRLSLPLRRGYKELSGHVAKLSSELEVLRENCAS